MKKQWMVLFVLILAAGTAHAQLSASHPVGDMGLQSGSQAPPGYYAIYMLYNYSADTIAGQDGRELQFREGGIGVWAHALGFSVVTNKKFLGANYGAVLFLTPAQNIGIEAPRVDLNEDVGYGFGDTYIMPIQLGWHKKQADITTWYAFYAPTGRYTAGADDNIGYGMWSHELALGTTLYFDEKRSFHAAALSAFEFHSEKEDSDAKAGTVLTLEGGLGYTYKQFLTLGASYYGQWKLTDDSGLDLGPIVENRLGKNHNFAIGPEVSIIFPLSKDFSKLMILGFRYEFETSTQLDTKGDIAAFMVTFKLR